MRKQRTLRGQHTRSDKKIMPWFYTCAALTILQYTFSLKIIDESRTYTLLVDLIPIVLGTIILGTFRWRYLLRRLTATKGILWQVGLALFFLLQGLLASWISFGLVARTTADVLNRVKAQTASVTVEEYPIKEALMGGGGRMSSCHIAFERDGRREQIQTPYIKKLSKQRWYPPFDITLELKEGILGCWIVESYALTAHPK